MNQILIWSEHCVCKVFILCRGRENTVVSNQCTSASAHKAIPWFTSSMYLCYMPWLQHKGITMKDAVFCIWWPDVAVPLHSLLHLEPSHHKRSATYITLCWLSITTAITPSPMPMVSQLPFPPLRTDYQSIMERKKKMTSSSSSSV